MRIAAFQPDIPQNLGALMRISVCFGMPLDVIEPCGFPFSTKAVKKAAMDYAADADMTAHPNWEQFLSQRPGGRLILLTTKAAVPCWDIEFHPDDTLLLGRESAGAPEEVHAAADARILIPMPGGGRSLNIAVSAGIVAAEATRQMSMNR
ncbi:MAG: tRNA (cytidine(34)-2'-O)-methyltransferase [Pikeienuella sp.]